MPQPLWESRVSDKWESGVGTVLSVFFFISLYSQGIQESWPALYTLPVLPPELQEALQWKDPSFKKKDKSQLRALLIQAWFDNVQSTHGIVTPLIYILVYGQEHTVHWDCCVGYFKGCIRDSERFVNTFYNVQLGLGDMTVYAVQR